jgi:hypothetical protein
VVVLHALPGGGQVVSGHDSVGPGPEEQGLQTPQHGVPPSADQDVAIREQDAQRGQDVEGLQGAELFPVRQERARDRVQKVDRNPLHRKALPEERQFRPVRVGFPEPEDAARAEA